MLSLFIVFGLLYWVSMARLVRGQYNRDEIYVKLARNDIYARKYFYPLTCDFECYKDVKADVPIARDIASKILTLPLYPDLSKEDIDRICNIIKE